MSSNDVSHIKFCFVVSEYFRYVLGKKRLIIDSMSVQCPFTDVSTLRFGGSTTNSVDSHSSGCCTTARTQKSTRLGHQPIVLSEGGVQERRGE